LILTGGSSTKGGAIYNSGSLLLDSVWVTSNVSSGDGGGVYNDWEFSAVNSIISGNRATGNGGGVYSTGRFSEDDFGYDALTLVNVTVTGNTAGYNKKNSGLGGGVYFQGIDSNEIPFAQARLYNSIIVQNLSGVNTEDPNIYNYAYSEDPTDEMILPLEGDLDGEYNLTTFTGWYDWDNIEYNQVYDESIKLFTQGYNFDSKTEGDYSLAENELSQAIDEGSEYLACYMNGETLIRDFAGSVRVQGSEVDIGAFEKYALRADVETYDGGSVSTSASVIGGTISIDGIVVYNVGEQDLSSIWLCIYASLDEYFDSDEDEYLTEAPVGSLAAQETRVVSTGEILTYDLTPGSNYYFFWQVVVIDGRDVDESNNVGRTTETAYFYAADDDIDLWTLNQSEFSVQQGCDFYVKASSEEGDVSDNNLSFWYNYGDGVFRQGTQDGWVSPSQYVQTPGVYTLILQIVDEDLRKVVGLSSASLEVKETSPSVNVDATTLGDGSVLRLNLGIFSACGLNVDKWEIDWGDGKSSSFETTNDSLIAAHYFVPQETDVSYNVQLRVCGRYLDELYLSEELEYEFEHEYSVYTFTSVGVAKSTESLVLATSGFYGPVLAQTKKKTISTSITPIVEAPLPNAKTKNVFEELCETNWLDED